MTFISNDLDLFNYSQQHAKKIDETENEFQRLKQELLEVFFTVFSISLLQFVNILTAKGFYCSFDTRIK